VVAAFASVAAYRAPWACWAGTAARAGGVDWFRQPVAFDRSGIYVLRNFGNVTAYLATYARPERDRGGARHVGEIPITGHLPVTIPVAGRIRRGIQVRAHAGERRAGRSKRARVRQSASQAVRYQGTETACI